MEINDKYKPLFQILVCWDVVKSKTFKDDYTEEEQAEWIALSKVDTVMVSGGRDSGKTFGTSVWSAIAAKDHNHRIMYTRYTMSSTDHSISKSIEDRMERLGIAGSFNSITNHHTAVKGKGEIVITGQKTSSNKQTAKMKGIEDFTIFITDEGEELQDFEEWDKASKSFRGKDVQCLSMIIFNPPTKEHFIYQEFWEDMEVEEGFCGIKENVLYIHSTYLDNYDNLADHLKRQYNELRLKYEEYDALNNKERESASPKIKKAWKKYKNVILGGFKDVADGVIYEDWDIGEFNEDLLSCYGLDFGASDPNALTKIAVDHRNMKIYVKECYFNTCSTPMLMQVLHNVVGVDQLIIADSAQKQQINDLYGGMHNENGEWLGGVNIRKVRKKKGDKQNYVARGISILQGYTFVIDPASKNIKKSISNYCWHDKRADVPNHNWSDLMDSIRYGALELIEY